MSFDPGELLSGGPTTWLAGTLVLVTLGFLLGAWFARRRRRRHEIREIVSTIEDLRTGETERRAAVPSRSNLVMVSDALNRLGQQLAERRAETETAALEAATVIDAVGDLAIVSTDEEWRIRAFNAGASSLFGWPPESAVSRPVAMLFVEEAWKDLLPKLVRRDLGRHGVDTRSIALRGDGTDFHARVRIRPLLETVGDSQGLVFLFQDVTAEVQVENELRDAERRYRSLLERLGAGVALVQDGRIVLANPSLASLCGVDESEITGTLFREWVFARDVLLVRERFRFLESSPGSSEELRISLRGPDGDPVPVRIAAIATRYHGEPAVIASVTEEAVSPHLEAERLRVESRVDAVVEADPDALLVLADSPAGAVVRMTNRAFLRMFALREAQVLGATEGTILRLLREQGGGAEHVAAFVAAEGAGVRTDTVTLDGHHVELRLAPMASATGTVHGKILSCRDLTDQKAFERKLRGDVDDLRRAKVELEEAHGKLRAIHAELTRRMHELEELNRELRRLDDMKSEALENASHELQTPLVSIRGYTEMVLQGRLGPVTEEQRKGLEMSLRNVDRLIELIDSLLTLARADAGSQPQGAEVSTFSLHDLVGECVEMLGQSLQTRKVTVTRRFDPIGLAVRADRGKILQVFANLLSNAIKFNHEGGTIDVSGARGGPGKIRVEVRDSGIGIPEEDLERVFDRFYRVGGSGDAPDGSGIGLSIVREILAAHGCSIHASSRPGKGTTFTFDLPAAEAGSGEPKAPEPFSPTPRPRLRVVRPKPGS